MNTWTPLRPLAAPLLLVLLLVAVMPILDGYAVRAAGALDHIVISPSSATVAAHGPQAYTAEAFDALGNSLGDVTGETTFSISPDGVCFGNTCTAIVASRHTVTGTYAGLSATATLDVMPGALDHIVISPSAATIMAGASQAYTAEGFDLYGNSLGDVTGATTFTISPDGSCAGASCSATGGGSHTVTGSYSGKSATATLLVDGTAPTIGAPTTGYDSLSRKYAQWPIQDTVSGLGAITVTKLTNFRLDYTFDVSPGTPGVSGTWVTCNAGCTFSGQTSQMYLRATRLDQTKSASIAYLTRDVAGNVNAVDPTAQTVSRVTGAPLDITFSNIPQFESKITVVNGNPGLTAVRITVNGRRFTLSGLANGETRQIDVASAMRPGSDNTISLTGSGRPNATADVLISDL